MATRLGILAGEGPLPARLMAACRETGREFFVLAFEGHTDASALDRAPHAWVRLGAAGTGLELLKRAEVGELVMAGPIARPSLASLRPDLRTAQFFATLGPAAFGDNGLLSGVVRALEAEGFRVVGPDAILNDLLAPPGVYGRVEPDAQARLDIDRGIEVARALGAKDVGQAAVVQQGIVLGVEAAEGTDALVTRCGALQREGPGGVLVKVRKPEQERRVDLPTIGIETVRVARAAGLRGIAVEAGGALVLDRPAVARAADAASLFVVGVEVPK
ncbi:MAG: LpxI family protein [Alphaproteobacteria bacterium]